MEAQPRSALVLAPHTDDGEFGAGGLISKWVDRGVDVTYVAFSAAEESVLPEFPRDILRREAIEALSALGVSSECCRVLDFPVRYFPAERQRILETMVGLNTELNPDLVLLPSTYDIHQDHSVICQEGVRAFKRSTILGYEVPWNNFKSEASGFAQLDECHIQRKVHALQKYQSQKHRNYASEEFIVSLARVRGIQVGVQFAECFQVIRWVWT